MKGWDSRGPNGLMWVNGEDISVIETRDEGESCMIMRGDRMIKLAKDEVLPLVEALTGEKGIHALVEPKEPEVGPTGEVAEKIEGGWEEQSGVREDLVVPEEQFMIAVRAACPEDAIAYARRWGPQDLTREVTVKRVREAAAVDGEWLWEVMWS